MEYRIFEDPSDVSDFMPCKLDWQERWVCNDWLFWSSSPDDELQYQQRKFTAAAPISRHNNKLLRGIEVVPYLRNRLISVDAHFLAQLWVPVDGKGSKFLSIADQYFVLTNGFDGRLCEYRRICLNTLIPVDTNNAGFEGLLGPVERAFISGLIEFSPDLQSDSAGESPLLQHAIRLGIRQHWACPLIHGKKLRAVVEFALVGSIASAILPDSSLLEGWHHYELELLESMLSTVCKRLRVPFAQIWIPVSQSKALIRTDRRYWESLKYYHPVADASEIRYTEKGKVLVGKAFLSQGSCFCEDVTRLSLAEYPQMPYAQKLGLTQCFAICLRSSIHNRDFVFVVEYFLPPEKMAHKDAVTFLDKLLSTMKEEFKEVSLASGEELGWRILVKLVKVSPRDELDSFQIGQPLPSAQPLQDGQGVTPSVGDQECPNLAQENGGTGHDAHKRSPAKEKACDSVMFAKVTYGGFIIKFKLSASSTKEELEGQVEKWLHISPQQFSIEYQDGDDDWILTTCDSHLRNGMDELRSLGKSTMKFRVTLKLIRSLVKDLTIHL